MKKYVTFILFASLFLTACEKKDELKTMTINTPNTQVEDISTGILTASGIGEMKKLVSSGSIQDMKKPDFGENVSANKPRSNTWTDTTNKNSVNEESISKDQACILSDWNHDQWFGDQNETHNFWKTKDQLFYFIRKYDPETDAVTLWIYLNKYDCVQKKQSLIKNESFWSGMYLFAEVSGVTPKNIFMYMYGGDSVGYFSWENKIYDIKTGKASTIDWSLFMNSALIKKYSCGKFTVTSDTWGVLSCSSWEDYDDLAFLIDLEKKRISKQ